jgi:predicted small metal-binding protein
MANPEHKHPTASRPGVGAKTFRCADVGFADCRWEVSGHTEDELMPQIEQHGREHHGLHHLDDNVRRRVKGAIRTRAA